MNSILTFLGYSGLYVAIGMGYTLLNVFVRKLMDENSDPLLVLVWMFLWPIAFLALLGRMIGKILLSDKI